MKDDAEFFEVTDVFPDVPSRKQLVAKRDEAMSKLKQLCKAKGVSVSSVGNMEFTVRDVLGLNADKFKHDVYELMYDLSCLQFFLHDRFTVSHFRDVSPIHCFKHDGKALCIGHPYWLMLAQINGYVDFPTFENPGKLKFSDIYNLS